ncbi:MAG: TetR/AcrR family transcriptional regulator [Planctomycetota bacterium]
MKRLRAAERKEQLLDTAASVFASMGYARATTAELARAAGVTEPVIYRHFASKRDLFVALIERTGRDTLAHWEQELTDAEDPADRLLRIIGDNPMVSKGGRDAYRVFLQAISEIDDELVRSAVDVHIKALHAFLARELERAQAEGRVRGSYSAELIAWTILNMGLGYGVLAAMRIPGQGRDASGVHVKDVLRRLLLPAGEAEHGDEPNPAKKAPSKKSRTKKKLSSRKTSRKTGGG